MRVAILWRSNSDRHRAESVISRLFVAELCWLLPPLERGNTDESNRIDPRTYHLCSRPVYSFLIRCSTRSSTTQNRTVGVGDVTFSLLRTGGPRSMISQVVHAQSGFHQVRNTPSLQFPNIDFDGISVQLSLDRYETSEKLLQSTRAM